MGDYKICETEKLPLSGAQINVTQFLFLDDFYSTHGNILKMRQHFIGGVVAYGPFTIMATPASTAWLTKCQPIQNLVLHIDSRP